jgi:hypothetical protein
LQRGVRQDRARNLLLDLPDDQPAMDQIDWGDAEIARKQRTNDPVSNPPGFYVYLLRANFPVPANFETGQVRRLREEAKLKNAQANAARAQREIELHEQKEQYQSYVAEMADAHIKTKIPAAAVDRLLRMHMKKIREDCPQYRWPEPTLRDFAWRKIRAEVAAELNLPTFEEFLEERAGSLF